MAQRRIAAIAAGDTAAVMGSYADNAVLEWVGGPLDGRYAGQAAIGGVWGKFIAAQGPMQTRIGQVLESANPRGQTVVADVAFAGRMTVKVRYVMTYREGRLVMVNRQAERLFGVEQHDAVAHLPAGLGGETGGLAAGA